MFYSQFILAKKGPLGTIWIAAHLERKLRKNQVADTDIGVSVDSILFPDVPIALRLSSHLLLGVVRIYSRKVGYLFDDCSEALLKIKQAFRSTAVDLPPEESTAPYHSITLPETFDLDDFELPDNELYQGNYVDHHVSSREQITLQDTMEGVVYTTSQFGLDERFGDGDASQIGLDLDEELFAEKITVKEHDEILDNDVRAPSQSTVLKDTDANMEEILQDPASTTRRVDECNLSSVRDSDGSLKVEDHSTDLEAVGIENNESRKSNIYGGTTDVLGWSSHNDLDYESTRIMHPEENGHLSNDPKLEQFSLPTEKTKGDALGGPITGEEMNNGVVINNEPEMTFLDHVDAEYDRTRSSLDATAVSPSCSGVTPDLEDFGHKARSDGTYALASEGQLSLKPMDNLVEVISPRKVAPDSTYREESPGRPEVIDAESKEFQEPKDTETQNSFNGEEITSMEKPVLQACNSHGIERDRSSLEGESYQATDAVTRNLEISEKGGTEVSEDGQASCRDPNKPFGSALSNDICTEISNRSPTSDFPAPEKLLSVPEGLTETHGDDLPLYSSLDKGNLTEDDGVSGTKLLSGKKRSFTESTLTAQSFNSAESVGVHRSKRVTESIPDDDDLLSSILVGRRSSVLKMKPSPPVHETISLKRSRPALRVGTSRKKVLMDDMMVLHGDTIRHQLTSTEDIRRVRKKAPCTRPEISMIQRQFLEDEIFSESIYSGISKELSSLHAEAFNLSEIRVYEKDPVGASTEAGNNFESAVRPNTTEESATETNPDAVVDKNDFESQPSRATIQIETQELALECPDLEVQDQQQVTSTENAGLEPIGEREKMDSEAGNIADAVDSFDIKELELPSLVIGDKYDDRNASLQMDISCFSPEKILESQSGVEDTFTVESGNVGLDTVNANDCTEIRDNVDDEKPDHNVSLVTSPRENGAKPAESILDVKLGEIDADGVNTADFVCDEKDGASLCLIDGAQMDPQYSPGFDMDFKSTSFNEVVNPSYPEEADLLDIVDTEMTVLDRPIAEDRGDFEDATVANDIEFLNADDDDEEDEDNAQFAADPSFLENSGWSSRTRAVARYLQNLFDRDSVHGRKVLHMDNLLVNKTRKEASRMFFETLVLKTKDYLHVEQERPFDNISLKPRINLMKSSF
ncbi:sister chromatid cohesion 1 protein 4-like isoform X1 [Cucurbita pepo subsp. pepo]|uniref:sister chromatid cohesion 1 protein 4-like isoform X1 n=1 Tax=Cucurbita pepo subsp. pepo TaxID=3664 RepID=UPI000C9D2ACC|nr:sister chromatid cohesion 1 protein 4-like isoform X1 [Cucurbita pepo subsp. pepo]